MSQGPALNTLLPTEAFNDLQKNIKFLLIKVLQRLVCSQHNSKLTRITFSGVFFKEQFSLGLLGMVGSSFLCV